MELFTKKKIVERGEELTFISYGAIGIAGSFCLSVPKSGELSESCRGTAVDKTLRTRGGVIPTAQDVGDMLAEMSSSDDAKLSCPFLSNSSQGRSYSTRGTFVKAPSSRGQIPRDIFNL